MKANYSLKMRKGYDAKNLPVTEFILHYFNIVDPANLTINNPDYEKTIYRVASHNVNLEKIAEVRNYVKFEYIPYLKSLDHSNDSDTALPVISQNAADNFDQHNHNNKINLEIVGDNSIETH